MITLHASNSPNFGLPHASPFVIKAMLLLNMAGVDYEIAPAMPSHGPKLKIPFITTNQGALLGDSYFIKKYLETDHGADFYAGFSASDKATGLLIERLADEHLYWTVVYYRWAQDDNFLKGPAHFFDAMPQPMQDEYRANARKNVLDKLDAVGLLRHTPFEILAIATENIDAVSDILADKPFILGDNPSAADGSLFAHLAAMETDYFNSPIGDYIRTKPNLMEYLGRMRAKYFG